MAKVEVVVCDKCGKVGRANALPPEVEPLRLSDAVADYTVTLCPECQESISVRELRDLATVAPGGVVAGADRLAYLVER